jgi:hypothetical protein
LRNKIKDRRDEIHFVASELPETPAADPVPDEDTDAPPASAGCSNTNENNQETIHHPDDQSEGRSLGDPQIQDL